MGGGDLDMVKPEKIKSALYALHLILVRARFMALTKEPLEDVAMLLDYAEILPQMFVSEEDMTETYRQSLQADFRLAVTLSRY